MLQDQFFLRIINSYAVYNRKYYKKKKIDKIDV